MRTYGVLDLAFASLYAYLGFVLAPSRSPLFSTGLALLIALLALSGVMLVGKLRGARVVGIVAAWALLIFAALVILGLVASSAYLWGVYGPIGRGMAVVGVIAAALVIELCALLPIFQLRFLLASR